MKHKWKKYECLPLSQDIFHHPNRLKWIVKFTRKIADLSQHKNGQKRLALILYRRFLCVANWKVWLAPATPPFALHDIRSKLTYKLYLCFISPFPFLLLNTARHPDVFNIIVKLRKHNKLKIFRQFSETIWDLSSFGFFFSPPSGLVDDGI